jgi:hypothetical protein
VAVLFGDSAWKGDEVAIELLWGYVAIYGWCCIFTAGRFCHVTLFGGLFYLMSCAWHLMANHFRCKVVACKIRELCRVLEGCIFPL